MEVFWLLNSFQNLRILQRFFARQSCCHKPLVSTPPLSKS